MRIPGHTTTVARGDVPELQVSTELGPEKTRGMIRLPHAGLGREFVVHTNTVANARRALIERVFLREEQGQLVPPPGTTTESWTEAMREFKAALWPHLPRADPRTLEEFLAGYLGDRRYSRYAEAVESLGHTEPQIKDSYVAAFVKAEKAKPDACPRIIQPRTPRYNAAVGRWLRHLEKPLYKSVKRATKNQRVKAVISKGMNAEETASCLHERWSSYIDPVAVFTDASRFDQHFRVPALQFEHSIYKACYPRGQHQELDKLLSWQLSCKGWARCTDGTIRYRNTGGRMSGDMNTSTGNCLVMTAMLWAWANRTTNGRVDIIDNGDDAITIMERADYQLFCTGITEFFRGLGFTLSIDGSTTTFERISYCQTQPVYLGDKYIMVRDPRVAISKDCHFVRRLSAGKELARHVSSIGQCGLSLTGGCPVWQSFYEALLRNSGMHRRIDQETGMEIMARRMCRGCMTVSADTRVSFWLAFGIHPHDQVVMEEYHATWSFGTDIEELIAATPPDQFYVPTDF